MANKDYNAQEAIYLSNPFVSLASYLPTRDKVKLSIEQNYIDSSDLGIVSPHPTAVDPGSLIENDKSAKSNDISKMYKVRKGKDCTISFDAGVVNVN